MYLIDCPPPTISGRLHMGHLFSYAHMDFIARWHRYKGEKLLYPFCFDNNGLPTEKLARENGKDDPLNYSLEISETYKDFFNKAQFAFEGNVYHTFSEIAQKVAYLSFKDLKDKGFCYKAETDFLWCKETGTSISQNELDERGRYERTGTYPEIKKGEGWFVKMKDHIPRLREAIDKIDWKPEKYKSKLLAWLKELEFDWSISRERNYGISIPGEPGMTFDTWFVSSLTPQISYSTMIGEPNLSCPIFDVRFQGHEIIRTWALFTIAKSLYHNNQIPWKTIIISGLAMGKENRKLSKSEGAPSPAHYIDKYGAAGTRYWSALNQIGTDTKIDEGAMSKGMKLLTKIKNAVRFIEMYEVIGRSELLEQEFAEMNSKFSEAMDVYEWPSALDLLTKFFWGRFCDVYIEQSKKTPISESLKCCMDKMIPLFAIFLGDGANK